MFSIPFHPIRHADLSGDFDVDSECGIQGNEAGKWLIFYRRLDIPKTHRILDPQLGGGAILDL